jgi:acetyl esterase/lipase
MRLIPTLFLLSGLAVAAERGEEIRLWPNGAPGFENETAAEVFDAAPNTKLPKNFKLVHYPSIYVFLPAKEKANGAAVVVAPGGGHSQLVIDKEGWEIADWLNAQGVAAFVLKYRLARAPGSKYTIMGNELPDAARAMRVVRKRATEWGVDPARIGVMGFSAGAEVAALMATRFDGGNDSSSDAVDRVSSRPDFAVIVYPGLQSGPLTVPKDAPTSFFVCAHDDASHVVITVNMYLEFQKQGVPSELHIYTTGGHGFGMRHPALPVATWTDRLHDWMLERKLMKQ